VHALGAVKRIDYTAYKVSRREAAGRKQIFRQSVCQKSIFDTLRMKIRLIRFSFEHITFTVKMGFQHRKMLKTLFLSAEKAL